MVAPSAGERVSGRRALNDTFNPYQALSVTRGARYPEQHERNIQRSRTGISLN